MVNPPRDPSPLAVTAHDATLLDSALMRQARLATGFTERGLARHLGTNALRIRRLEAGVAHEAITVDLLVRLAAAIEVDPADLFRPHAATPARRTEPTRALSLSEARVLHRALNGGIPMLARGIAGSATAHLIATGVLVAPLNDPARATAITVADEITAALSPTPPPARTTQPPG